MLDARVPEAQRVDVRAAPVEVQALLPGKDERHLAGLAGAAGIGLYEPRVSLEVDVRGRCLCLLRRPWRCTCLWRCLRLRRWLASMRAFLRHVRLPGNRHNRK